uniref:Uncharacterized protein n=2 Tax=Poecilia formosa TaxID=48698 RepID=A0A096MAA5_POEFO
DRPKLQSSHSMERCPSVRLNPTEAESRRSCWLSPEESLDRNKLSPTYIPESSILKRPASFRSAGKQLRRQAAVCCDSLDQSGSADDLAETCLTEPPAASPPLCQRSSSVHTLKYTHPQRVISCRSHSRSHSETTTHEHVPEQASCDLQPDTEAEKRPVSPQGTSSLNVTSTESILSASLLNHRAAGSDPAPMLDDADEEVDGMNGSVTQPAPGGHLFPSPGEQRSRFSHSASPVSGRSRKHRMSPPPGDKPVTKAPQLLDSSVELRRRTLSFDATTVSPNQQEGSSVED